MLVNKSSDDIICEDQVIKARTNDYVSIDKIKDGSKKQRKNNSFVIQVSGYEKSDPISLELMNVSHYKKLNYKSQITHEQL
jgi:hypothetical protein